ncbi:hypothetical protein [Burkholderia ubonensis]|uniref:Uncharacterized protein n=1 Tax=Burkholderia ubonensis subsp. mesacidophila TaxID=265293 RepID=A0A2A4FCM7_9BURK|nr:hypothetical protein [Burkholderia ubonensis]PCE30354.1 hypothetical protein BZL54_21930 [Burkholderia ubonensis subsp. mesacidophila]
MTGATAVDPAALTAMNLLAHWAELFPGLTMVAVGISALAFVLAVGMTRSPRAYLLGRLAVVSACWIAPPAWALFLVAPVEGTVGLWTGHWRRSC